MLAAYGTPEYSIVLDQALLRSTSQTIWVFSYNREWAFNRKIWWLFHWSTRLNKTNKPPGKQRKYKILILNINTNATMKVIVKYVISCLSPPGYNVNEVMMLRNLWKNGFRLHRTWWGETFGEGRGKGVYSEYYCPITWDKANMSSALDETGENAL